MFLTRVLERHEVQALFSGLVPWPCVVCSNPTAEALHYPLPYLTNAASETPEIPPQAEVSDTVLPICNPGGECEEKAENISPVFHHISEHCRFASLC
jgi:hypothetical protein